jgi:hypothetical protein
MCHRKWSLRDRDVIILEEENRVRNNLIIKISAYFSEYCVYEYSNGSKDLIIGKLAGLNKRLLLILLYTASSNRNPLFFNPKQMTKWWQEGYEFAKSKKSSPLLFQNKKYIELKT